MVEGGRRREELGLHRRTVFTIKELGKRAFKSS